MGDVRCLHPESDTQMVCLDVAELEGIHSHQRTERLHSYKLILVARVHVNWGWRDSSSFSSLDVSQAALLGMGRLPP